MKMFIFLLFLGQMVMSKEISNLIEVRIEKRTPEGFSIFEKEGLNYLEYQVGRRSIKTRVIPKGTAQKWRSELNEIRNMQKNISALNCSESIFLQSGEGSQKRTLSICMATKSSNDRRKFTELLKDVQNVSFFR